jgi:hypothetical protein
MKARAARRAARGQDGRKDRAGRFYGDIPAHHCPCVFSGSRPGQGSISCRLGHADQCSSTPPFFVNAALVSNLRSAGNIKTKGTSRRRLALLDRESASLVSLGRAGHGTSSFIGRRASKGPPFRAFRRSLPRAATSIFKSPLSAASSAALYNLRAGVCRPARVSGASSPDTAGGSESRGGHVACQGGRPAVCSAVPGHV